MILINVLIGCVYGMSLGIATKSTTYLGGGGDFNIVRFQHECKERDDNSRDRIVFNNLISDLGLLDL